MWFDLNFPSEQRHVEVLAKIVSVYTYAGQGKFIIDCASTSTMGNGVRMYRLLGHTLQSLFQRMNRNAIHFENIFKMIPQLENLKLSKTQSPDRVSNFEVSVIFS